VLPGAGPPGAGGRSLAAGTGALMGAFHLVIHGNPVSPPSRRAWEKMTAGLFFGRRDLRHGRAPWPGPHRGPAGRAAGPHARGGRAGPSAGGYGSAALFLISRSTSHSVGGRWRQPGPGGPALRGTVRIAAWAGRHPKVPAGWNIAARRSVTRRCYRAGWGRCQGISPRPGARAPAWVWLVAPSLPSPWGPGWSAVGFGQADAGL
jgi:hypothetical protein